MYRSIFTYILIVLYSFSSLFSPVFAVEEWVILHDLNELPSSHIETLWTSGSDDVLLSYLSLLDERQWYIIAGKKDATTESEDISSGTLNAPNTPVKSYTPGKNSKIRGHIPNLEKYPLETNIAKNTVIRSKDGKDINPGNIGIKWLTPEKETLAIKKQKKRWNKKKGWDIVDTPSTPIAFEFWIEGQHLIFSSPVAITMDAPNMTDGIGMELFVLHEGDADFNTSWLSTDPTSGCNPDGTSTNPGNIATVRGGKVIFYTCGASSFTMNTTWGNAGTNDLRLVIGDCGQFQLYYNGTANMYTGIPPATGCNQTLDSWLALRIGATTYWSDWANAGTRWTTNSTTGSQIGNTYSWTTVLQRTVWTRNYQLILNWVYTAPNKYFTINWRVVVPAGNTNNVRFYIGNDSTVWGGDPNDVGYSGSTPTQTFWVYDSVLNQLSAIRYISWSMWTAGEVGVLGTVRGRIANGTDFNNTITASTDQWFWINWNFGTTPGTYSGTLEWRVTPFVSTNVPDLISWVGQPTPNLKVGQLSTIPLTVSNIGNTGSTGLHTLSLWIPTGILGPWTSFTSNGWSCGAQIGTGVTCTKNTTLSALADDGVNIELTPQPSASGQTLTLTGNIVNASDSNTTNNRSSVSLQVAVAAAPADSTAPVFSGVSIASGSLIPGWTFPINTTYFDTGSNIDMTSVTGAIYSWNTGTLTWNTTNLAPLYMTRTWVTINTGSFVVQNIPFGRYRFDFTIKDNAWNTRTRSDTYFVDQISWSISSDTYSLGDIPGNATIFWTGELTITIQTIGAGFILATDPQNPLVNSQWTALPYWNGTNGIGIDQWTGTGYLGNLTTYSGGYTIATRIKNINQNWLRTTYTYKIKYGWNFITNQDNGDYLGNVRFNLLLNY
jgi:hypothetical protein